MTGCRYNLDQRSRAVQEQGSGWRLAQPPVGLYLLLILTRDDGVE
ncbi:MAG: hypothetical protein P8Z30_08410 [Acidobacteriota bacterium]